eukprot:CAMPEP_0119305732 /NCGR_PEP_ID=MMETSP1333-20130426/6666_1 /TAXON_ID=418940 /ORGANISM="Scyphosphaera apsteinii, Strain RCC1455" /LENGTH=117 /DNA_ID=CAMNT_0007308899 /DNA_START=145 /DNA_END=498 /DNA_ORIENTATION=-
MFILRKEVRVLAAWQLIRATHFCSANVGMRVVSHMEVVVAAKGRSEGWIAVDGVLEVDGQWHLGGLQAGSVDQREEEGLTRVLPIALGTPRDVHVASEYATLHRADQRKRRALVVAL